MHISVSDFIMAVINFAILFIILYKVLCKPVTNMLEKRQNMIRENIEKADNIRVAAESMRDEISKELSTSRSTAQDIVNNATKAGDMAKEQIIADAKEEANKIIVRAQAEINDEKDRALNEIRNEAASLAMMAASKLISRSLNDEDHKQLVDRYIQEAGEIQ